MKSRVVGFMLSAGLLLGSAAVSPAVLTAVQESDNADIQARITTLENRVAGLEARVTHLEGNSEVEPEEADELYTLTGIFQVYYNLSATEGMECEAKDAHSSTNFSAVKEGAILTVHDAKRNEIASGTLSAGTIERTTSKMPNGQMGGGAYCVFSFEIRDIPASDKYVITFSAIEGDMVVSREDLDLKGWHLELGDK